MPEDIAACPLLPEALAGLVSASYYHQLEAGHYPPWQGAISHSFRADEVKPPVLVRQTHSALLHELQPGERDAAEVEADGIISAVPGLRIGVVTADCVPVLIAGARHVAALHCGWRGIQLGLLDRALNRLSALGEEPSQLSLLTGPFIQPPAFEVGPEVIAAFCQRPVPEDHGDFAGGHEGDSWLATLRLATTKGQSDRWHLDMGLLVAAIALGFGLDPRRIAISRECTKTALTDEGEGRWPSYRRSGKGCGRITSAIAL